MPPRPISQNSFLRGVVAVTNVLRQPKGSVPRASNLLMTRRDSLATCDGSLVLHEFNGQVQAGRGPILAAFLFQPAGVTPYYLLLERTTDFPLGKVYELAANLAAGGTLTVGTTYYYVVTALDGIGGETIASAEVSATPTSGNQKITLTWQGIPNGAYYNVYRGTAPGGELLLVGTDLPVPQPSYPPGTVTWTDTGADSPGGTDTISSISCFCTLVEGGASYYNNVTVTVASALSLTVGQTIVIAGVTPAGFNGSYPVASVLSSTEFTYVLALNTLTCTPIKGQKPKSCTIGGTGGTAGLSTSPPAQDTTQQCALFKCPTIQGPNPVVPASYTDADVIALYPADATVIPVGGTFITSGGQGGGGGSGGGGGIKPTGPISL